MTLQTFSLKKGKELAGHNIQCWVKGRPYHRNFNKDGIRCYATERPSASQLRAELAREHVKDLSNKQKAKKEARALDKDFFMSVLHSSATKRDAKAYLQRFTPKGIPKTSTKPVLTLGHKAQVNGNGVNLGGLYGPASVVGSPKFLQYPQKPIEPFVDAELHVALVKIRAPQILDDETLNGVGKTLSQLARLGLISVVVTDCDNDDGNPTPTPGPNWRTLATNQANRIVRAIDSNGMAEARLVDNVIGVDEHPDEHQSISQTPKGTSITLRKMIMTPLRRGVIPVIPSMGYTSVTQTAVSIPAVATLLALTKDFIGLPYESSPDEDLERSEERLQSRRNEISVDRIIILDPLGGIPSSDRPNGYHVYLNMEQEFEQARQDLMKNSRINTSQSALQTPFNEHRSSNIGASNPSSAFAENEFAHPLTVAEESIAKTRNINTFKPDNWYHLQNLELVRSALSILPPSSSALLTTPHEAANAGKETPFHAGGVGTRRYRNPLIHNLLTDKPVFSSSLPMGRLLQKKTLLGAGSVLSAKEITPTTFAKHGMHIAMIPDPNRDCWQPHMLGRHCVKLTDSCIDLPRLVHLIEDSFGRTLDVEDYLKRVNDRIAGVIIAGEYEGGAILTWETPPCVPDDGRPESRARMVPYLDKFAVLKKSQGSGGVADAVFTAMVRTCLPHGVVWRSRSTNVVNKWYFERSRGTWKLSNTGWTMFWTTPDMDRQTFLDYEAVCRGIQPSWADGKKQLD